MSNAARLPKGSGGAYFGATVVTVARQTAADAQAQAAHRIVANRDPRAHGATAPWLTAAADAAVHGAKARPADAVRPPSEGMTNV